MPLLDQDEILAMVETVNELANATLLEICVPGALEDNGDPGGQVTVWKGGAAGMLERTARESTSGERERQGLVTSFRVYDAVAPGIEIAGPVATASTVVLLDSTRATPVKRRFTVMGTIKETEGTLDSITLELDNETEA